MLARMCYAAEDYEGQTTPLSIPGYEFRHPLRGFYGASQIHFVQHDRRGWSAYRHTISRFWVSRLA